MEFLVTLELSVQRVPEDRREQLFRREAEVATAFKRAGTIVRMWRLPGRTATVSVWSVADATELHERLGELPLLPWMRVEVTALARHYVDDA